MPDRRPSRLTRLFGNLKVRPKLMVLHNLFFLLLASSAYFTLIPLFEKQVADAKTRQIQGVEQQTTGPVQATQAYQQAVTSAKVAFFVVLGVIYVLAVMMLEFAIMPLYVYQPLDRMLAADAATQSGDRNLEMIPTEQIFGDEIGQLMQSRNRTVEALRQNEDKLAAALQRLEAQDRLVSLGLLSASVAHELNTPLAVLNGSLEKVIEHATDPALLERLQRMQRVARRITGISESLLDFARVRTQHMVPVAVLPLVEEAWALVAIDDKAGRVQFTMSIAEDLRVIANSGRIVQVLVNLLRNALNAVADIGGEVEATARPAQLAGTPGVAISILDNGPGIPPEVLPDIFDAFVTSRLDSRGTGLGLTIAEGIVAQHGGTIQASNRIKGGAALEFWLPAPTSPPTYS